MHRAVFLFLALVLLAGQPGPAAAETRIRVDFGEASKDLRGGLSDASLLLQAKREGVTDTQELLAAARADYARLVGILYENAHYGGVVSITVDGREAADIAPLAAPDEIARIVVTVRPGPVYLFSQATAAPLAPRTQLPDGFARGNPAELGVIRDAATEAVDSWRRQGNAKARVASQSITARHAERSLSARLDLEPGPVLAFGDLRVKGNEDVRPRRIRTIAGLETGRRYDPDEIARAEKRLRRTGSFSSVVIEEDETPAPDGTLPLTIAVVEQPPRRLGFGAEYSTIEGVRLTAFWMHRNLLGGAERFRVDGEVAGISGETGGTDYKLQFRYERPATPRADVDLFANLAFERLEEPLYSATGTEFVLGFTRYATDQLEVNFGLGVLSYNVATESDSTGYDLLILPLGAEYDRRRNPLNPKDGYYINLEMTPFYAVSGTDSGMQTKLDARGYESFGADERVTVAARVQLGSLVGPGLDNAPPFYLFYSGGGGTVRGQNYESLTVDNGGTESGGRAFLGLSGELRFGVTETIEAVGFYDWGYVGAESFPDLSGNSHAGAGLGLRYNTGIGPIRFDLATPVTGPDAGKSVHIYIGIGQAF